MNNISVKLVALFMAVVMMVGIVTPTMAFAADESEDDSYPVATATDRTPTDSTPTDSTPTDRTPTDSTPTDSTPTDPKPQEVPHKHEYKKEVKNATCTEKGLITYKCECGSVKTEEIKALGHQYGDETVKKADASTKTDGSITKVCNVCGYEVVETISAPKTVKLAKASYAYTGKNVKPKVRVLDGNGNEIDSSNYTVKYSKNKKIGKATITITFTGDNYTGSLKKTFKIVPKGTSLAKVKSGSKSISIKLKKQTKKVKGYEIQYSTSKNFKKKVTKTLKIKDPKKLTVTLTKLKANKKYYVRVRTYTTVKKTAYNSKWSRVKSVKTKR